MSRLFFSIWSDTDRWKDTERDMIHLNKCDVELTLFIAAAESYTHMCVQGRNWRLVDTISSSNNGDTTIAGRDL